MPAIGVQSACPGPRAAGGFCGIDGRSCDRRGAWGTLFGPVTGRTPMRCAVVAVAAAFALAEAALSQTTPTERAAARDVLARIDTLQARLNPTELARRLAARRDPDRDGLLRRVEELWRGGLEATSDWIGRHPEVGFEERKAVDTLTALLKARGFTVETGQAGLATAFVICAKAGKTSGNF